MWPHQLASVQWWQCIHCLALPVIWPTPPLGLIESLSAPRTHYVTDCCQVLFNPRPGRLQALRPALPAGHSLTASSFTSAVSSGMPPAVSAASLQCSARNFSKTSPKTIKLSKIGATVIGNYYYRERGAQLLSWHFQTWDSLRCYSLKELFAQQLVDRRKIQFFIQFCLILEYSLNFFTVTLIPPPHT